MRKFWDSSQFKDLQEQWYRNLKSNGFKDCEDKSGNLTSTTSQRKRTIAFENRERIQNFFRKLDSYLTNCEDLNPKHREVLELYSEGIKIKGKGGIAERTGLSNSWIRAIIKRYKAIILNQ
jgi:DNA-binding NarL/FixJ family response regulator